MRLPLSVSYCVVDVESAVLVASGDVVSKQCVAPAVYILCFNSGHRSVYGCAFAHAGVAWQVQEHRVVVVDVPDVDSDHNLRKMRWRQQYVVLIYNNFLIKALDLIEQCVTPGDFQVIRATQV